MTTDLQGADRRLCAVRGATTCASNDASAIVEATAELLTEILTRNQIERDDLVSLVFTATPDLDAAFPAVAARQQGLEAVPLLCAQEMDVPGAVPRCIRVLIHLYSALPAGDIQHVYLRDARSLRTDLSG